MMAICRWDNLQYLGTRLDPIHIPMLVNVGIHFFSSPPYAAWAKKELGLL